MSDFMSELKFTWGCFPSLPSSPTLWSELDSQNVGCMFLFLSCEVKVAFKDTVPLSCERNLGRAASAVPFSPWLWAWHCPFKHDTMVSILGSRDGDDDYASSGLPVWPFCLSGLFSSVQSKKSLSILLFALFNTYSFLSELRFFSWVK